MHKQSKIKSSFVSDRQMFGQFQESRASPLALENNLKSKWSPLLPPFLQLSLLSMMPYSIEYPFGQLWSPVPTVPSAGGFAGEAAREIEKPCYRIIAIGKKLDD